MRSTLMVGVSVAVVLGAGLIPLRSTSVRAQTAAPPVSCSGSTIASPMAGTYSGPWHSDAAYHFYVFGKDLELQIVIDGTINATFASGGQISGSVQGTVSAPITHDGAQDVSSGYGTITGQISGALAPGGSAVVLSHPVIDMHWGTFVGGGYTVERFITMPDYQFPVGSFDCISASGTIAEQGFPTMNIVDDGAGLLTQAPGLGSATGTWQLQSVDSAAYSQLSQQVDTFVNQASTLLTAPDALTATQVTQQVLAPLQQLETTIRQHPDVAGCLLDRIGTWEATTLPALFARARSFAAGDLIALRQGFDLLHAAKALNADCNLADGGAAAALVGRGQTILDAAITTHSWQNAALAARELLLAGGESARPALQAEIDADLQSTIRAGASGRSLLDLARIAYAFGDDRDAQKAAGSTAVLHQHAHHKNKHKRKHKKKKTAAPAPIATPTSTPRTLAATLAAGIISIKPTISSGNQLSWTPVIGAQSYVVTATSNQDPKLLWSWAGSNPSVAYGDTSFDGVTGSGDDTWPAAPAGFAWSVLALDGSGRVIGAAFRVVS